MNGSTFSINWKGLGALRKSSRQKDLVWTVIKKDIFCEEKKKEDFVKILSKNSKSYATIMCHRILKKEESVKRL